MILKLKINKEQIISTILLFILFLCFQGDTFIKFIPNQARLFSILLAFVGLFFFFVLRRNINREKIFCFLVAIVALVYSYDYSESIRYFLLLISIMTWREFSLHKLEVLVKVFVIEGFITSVYQLSQGSVRVNGFLASPPQFACLMFVCLSYLLVLNFNQKNKPSIDVYCLICLILIYVSETRTSIMGGLGISIFYLLLKLLEEGKISNKKALFIGISILGGIFLIINLDFLITLMSRSLSRSSEALLQSNNTRTELYNIFLRQMQGDLKMLMIGKGGGYVEKTIESIYGISYYLPVHQDFIMILSEYGLIGLIIVFYTYLKDRRTKWLFIAIFTICSFHNILLSPRVMVLLTITMQDIENRSAKVFISKS